MGIREQKKSKLTLMLNALVENLEEQGLLPKMDADEKKALVQEVVNQVVDQIPDLELVKEDKQIKNALSLSLIATFVSEHNPDFKLDIKNLFDRNASLAEQEQNLKIHFTALLLSLNQTLKPELRLKPDAVIQQAETLTKACIKDHDKDCLAENETIVNTMALLMNNSLALTLSNLFGGLDPTTGIFVKTVEFEVGNLIGIADQSGANAGTSKAFIDVINANENVALGVEHTIPYQLEKSHEKTQHALEEIGTSLVANPHPGGT